MQHMDFDWRVLLKQDAAWDALPRRARETFLDHVQPAAVPLKALGEEGRVLEEAGYVRREPGGLRVRLPGRYAPIRKMMQALIADPVPRDERPYPPNGYLSSQFDSAEMVAFRPPGARAAGILDLNGFDPIAWNEAFLDCDDERGWERDHGLLPRRGAPRVVKANAYFSSPAVFELTKSIWRWLSRLPEPQHLQTLLDEFDPHSPADLAAALRAGVRYLILFPIVDPETLRLKIGLLPRVLRWLQRELAPRPEPVEVTDPVHAPYLIADMNQLLALCQADPPPLRTDDHQLYVRTCQRLLERAMPVPPDFLPARPLDTEIRFEFAKEFLMQCELARVEYVRSKGLRLLATARGEAWLLLDEKAQLITVINFVRDGILSTRAGAATGKSGRSRASGGSGGSGGSGQHLPQRDQSAKSGVTLDPNDERSADPSPVHASIRGADFQDEGFLDRGSLDEDLEAAGFDDEDSDDEDFDDDDFDDEDFDDDDFDDEDHADEWAEGQMRCLLPPLAQEKIAASLSPARGTDFLPLNDYLDYAADNLCPLSGDAATDEALLACFDRYLYVHGLAKDQFAPVWRMTLERLLRRLLFPLGGIELARQTDDHPADDCLTDDHPADDHPADDCLADDCLADVHLAFRITAIGEFFLNWRTDFDYESLGRAEIVVQPNFEIVFLSSSPVAAGKIGRFAERSGIDDGTRTSIRSSARTSTRAGARTGTRTGVRTGARTSAQDSARGVAQTGTLFKITRSSILAAAATGSTSQGVLTTLRELSSKPVPKNVTTEIEGWFAQCRRVRIAETLIIECPDEETARRVLAVGKNLVRPLGGRVVEVRERHHQGQLVRRLRKEGLFA